MSMPVQQQIPSIDAYINLRQSMAERKPDNISTIKSRIEIINKRELNGTKEEYREVNITEKEVNELNKALRESKTIQQKALAEISGPKRGWLKFLNFVFGYKGFVPQIDATKFVSSVDTYHVQIKTDKLSKSMEAPVMREENLDIGKDLKCYRVWKDSDNRGSFTVTLAEGGQRKHYVCNLDQLSKGAVVLQNRDNASDTITLSSKEFKDFLMPNSSKSGKELGGVIEKLVQQKTGLKSYGQVQLDALLDRHIIKDQTSIGARLRKCQHDFQKNITAVSRNDNQYTMKVCSAEKGVAGGPDRVEIKDYPVIVDTQGKVRVGNNQYDSVRLFEAAMFTENAMFLDVAEADQARTAKEYEIITATKQGIENGARGLKIYDGDVYAADSAVSELRRHVEAGVKAEDLGAIIAPTHEMNRMNVVAVVDGHVQKFPLVIKNDGRMEFRGNTYDAKTPVTELLKGLTINPMAKSRAEYEKNVSALQRVCNVVKHDPNYYGYDTSLKLFDDFEKFFPAEKLAGTCVINPGKAPQESAGGLLNAGWNLLAGAAKAVYKKFVPASVNAWLTNDFKEFTISVHDGKKVDHYEVTIDVDNKAAPYKLGDKNYAKTDDIIREKLGALPQKSYTTIDQQMKDCQACEAPMRRDRGFIKTADERDAMINEIDFQAGDYAIVEQPNSKGLFQITFFKGEGDDCECYTAVCSTREVPGKITIVSENLQNGAAANFQVGQQFKDVLSYLGAHALRNCRPMSDVARQSGIAFEEPVAPVNVQPQVGAQLVQGDVSGRADYLPSSQLGSIGKAEKALKYCVSWDDSDGAVIKRYDPQGFDMQPDLVIRRQGNKYMIEGEEATYKSIEELVRTRVGVRQPVRPHGQMVDTVVAGKAKTTGAAVPVAAPAAPPKPASTHSLSSQGKIPAGVLASLRLTNPDKNRQVMVRLIAARAYMNGLDDGEKRAVREEVRKLVFEGADTVKIMGLLATEKGTKGAGDRNEDLQIGNKLPKQVLSHLSGDDRKVGKKALHAFAHELTK